MVADDKRDDIDRVRREEEQRGKRRPPPDKDKLKSIREQKKQWRDILQAMTWKEVTDALGLQPGMPEYDDFYQTWREYQQDRAEAEKKLRRRGPGKP
ncbi:MAG: hypothetical protein HY581_00585 [Nitrospirae bacterium]|nr:hypothetical protein [Nitrospirota bacterium]